MLTALPQLPKQLKSDPVSLSAHRHALSTGIDGSFASLIRHQTERRMDALRLADQQALATRVSAAAATPMPRPGVEQRASPPPMPSQAPAEPSPQPPAAAPAVPAARSDGPHAAAAASKAHQAPPQSARAKAPAASSRPEPARTPPARSGADDSPGAGPAARQRKPGGLSDTDAAAVNPACSAECQLPPALGSGLTTLAAERSWAETQDLDGALGGGEQAAAQAAAQVAIQAASQVVPPIASATALQPGLAPQADGAAVQAAQGVAGSAAPARPTTQPSAETSAGSTAAGTAAIRTGLTEAQTLAGGWAAGSPERALRHRDQADQAGAWASDVPQPPLPAPLPAPDANASAAAAVSTAHASGSRVQNIEPGGAGGEREGAAGARPDRQDSLAAPAKDLPVVGAPRGPAGPDAPTPAPPDAALAAGPSAQAEPGQASPQTFDASLQGLQAPGLARAGAAATAERAAAALPTLQIDAPVDSPLFAPALGSQLSLLARDGVRSALLQLHPAEMGPISVEIALDGNAARIDFQALRADTRGFIEASLPALAGALQDAGLTLAGGGVFEQAPGRQPQAQAEPGQRGRQPERAGVNPGGSPGDAPPARPSAPRGLVDLVA